MTSGPQWQYDESRHAGVDYSDDAVVLDYDNRHTRFRDYEKEATRIIDALGLTKDSIVVDMGCGSGGLSVHFAKHCGKVHAVDVSPKMVELCGRKAGEQNLKNIETVCAGFLTYEHKGEPPDAIVSTAVLHHLPDFWKQVALRRMYEMLKPGGKLFLFDIVFNFPVDEYQNSIDGWLESIEKMGGKAMKDESVIHVKEEFSTWGWIMERMIEIAGFRIDINNSIQPNMQVYICSKT
ncbi:MAG: class I SAM-dependent methyltransferase [Candidatus Latescibacteria bacterium]|nr:class I SAM-dependent methyltransferase [Candidatus Latescibacterota bacterium]